MGNFAPTYLQSVSDTDTRRCVVLSKQSIEVGQCRKRILRKNRDGCRCKKNVFEDAETGKWFIIDWRKERLILVILDKIRNK